MTIVLSACGDTSSTNSEKNRRLYGAKNLEEAVGVFYRIQASYEVIKTGEPIDFDFIVSCYNRDVPGSFHGIIKPTTMFKATQDGAAIAIAPPKFYCERGLKGKPIEYETDRWKMPMLAWYPDVNDLSLAFIYATNDAYTGPKAEVKFKSYGVTPTDRESFFTWQKKTQTEYTQIGAIPGPFGCTHWNVGKGDPYDCALDQTRERNGNKSLAMPEEWLRYTTVVPFPEGFAASFREEYDFSKRYFCFGMVDVATGEQVHHGLNRSLAVKRLLSQLQGNQVDKAYRYLDPDELLNNTRKVKIRAVYPHVAQKHHLNKEKEEIPPVLTGRAAVTYQVLLAPEWKGFAIKNAKRVGFSSIDPETNAPNYQGKNRGAFYISDQYACEFPAAIPGADIYDLESQIYIRIGPGGSVNTRW